MLARTNQKFQVSGSFAVKLRADCGEEVLMAVFLSMDATPQAGYSVNDFLWVHICFPPVCYTQQRRVCNIFRACRHLSSELILFAISQLDADICSQYSSCFKALSLYLHSTQILHRFYELNLRRLSVPMLYLLANRVKDLRCKSQLLAYTHEHTRRSMQYLTIPNIAFSVLS